MKKIARRLKNFLGSLRFFYINLFGWQRSDALLVSGQDLAPSHHGFLALAIDPQLTVYPRNLRLWTGWYLISYEAKSGFPDCIFTPTIYPLHLAKVRPTPRSVPSNFGLKPDSMGLILDPPEARPNPQGSSINLKAHFVGKTSHLIHYPFSPGGFRLDPFDAEYPRTRVPQKGWFDIENFTITCLGIFPLMLYCGKRLLSPAGDKRIRQLLRRSFVLLRYRGGSRFLRWAIHRTYREIQPAISLDQWWRFYKSQPSPEAFASRMPSSSQLPLISLVLFHAPTHANNLDSCVRGLSRQAYQNFEVIIISNDKKQRSLRYPPLFNGRVHEVSRDPGSVWSAIRGAYVGIVDASVSLEPHALRSLANAIAFENPDILYADEVIQSSHSERVKKIRLKPAFSIDHFLCNGFTGMPTLIRTSILDQAEACWCLESADAVSESLVLQGLRQSSKVLHIPDILSTRRCLSGHGNPARLPPLETEKKLRELGFKDASVRASDNPEIYRVRFSKESSRKTAIVIPTKNNVGLLRQTIESIQKTTPAELYSLVVVDHESDDPACVSYLQSLGEKHLVLPYKGAFNFSKINNFAVTHIDSDHETILFLNNDIEAISSGWLESMRDKARRPDVGAVGAILLYPSAADENTVITQRPVVQHAGVVLGIGAAEHFMKNEVYFDPYQGEININGCQPDLVTRGFSAVTAACLMTRRAVFDEISGFDESLAVAFGDVDLCLRIGNLGYKVVCDGEAVLLHHESATRDKGIEVDPHPGDSDMFKHRYRFDIRRGDPFYHPLLVRNSSRYRLIRSPVKRSEPVYRIVNNPGFSQPR
jgi:GT2 family glycosyltransferase